MATIAKLAVELSLDDNAFTRGIDSARDRVDKMAASARKWGGIFTAGVTTPLIGAGVAFVNWASDVEESTSAVTQVYGAGSDFIIGKSEDAANAVFLSQGEYLEAAATLGVYGKTAGLTGDELATFGDNNIAAAADLASFYNAAGGVPEVLNAIQSGLVGEYEPLRQYGIVLNEAAINEYAWANGIAARGDALTEQEKILARYGLIMESLGPAQGDAQRTANGLANSTRRLQARFKDIGATIGRILLPVANQLVDAIDTLFDWIEKLTPAQQRWVVGLAAVAAAIGPLLLVIGMLLPGLSAMLGLLGLLISPLGLIVAAAGLLAYVFRDELGAALDWIMDKVREFTDRWKQFREAGLDPVQSALVALQQLFPALGAVIAPLRGMFDSLLDAFNALKAGNYPEVFAKLGEALRNLGSAVKAAFTSIDWGAIGSTLLNGAQAAVNGVIGVLSSIDIPEVGLTILKWLVSAAQSVMDAIKGWLGFGPSNGMSGDGTGGAMPGRSVDIEQVGINVLKWLVSTAQDVVEAIKDHIMPVVADLTEWTLNVALPAVYFVGWNVAEAILKKMTRTVVRLTEWTMNVEAADVVDVLFDVAGAIYDAIKEDPIKVTLGAALITLALVGAPIIVLGAIALYIAMAFIKAMPDSVLINATVLMFSLINFAVEVIGLIAEVTLAILLELAKAPIAVGGFTVELAQIAWDILVDVVKEIGDAILALMPDGIDLPSFDVGLPNISWPSEEDLLSLVPDGVKKFLSDPFGWAMDQIGGGGGDDDVELAPFIGPGGGRGPNRLVADVDAILGQFDRLKLGFGDIKSEFDTNIPPIGSGFQKSSTEWPVAPLAAVRSVLSGFQTNLPQVAAVTLANFSAAKAAATSNVDAMRSSVSNSAETMKSNVSLAMTGTQTAVALQSMLMMAAAKAQGLAMVQNATSAANSLRSVLTSGAAAAASGVASGLGRIPGIVSSVGGQAVSIAYSIGANISNAFASGMLSALGTIQAAANSMVAAASTALVAKAMIASPSKLFMGYGEYVSEGFEQGIRRGIPGAAQAARDLVGAPNLNQMHGANGVGAGQIVQQIFYSVTPEELRKLIQDAEDGGTFARQFGAELGLRGGVA